MLLPKYYAQGLQGLTVGAVVAEAKVSKSTVYRLQEAKSAVDMDAILMFLNTGIETPDTESAID
jgi:hypothetical protein